MSSILLDRVVDTSYGHFTIEWGAQEWDGEIETCFTGQRNGWVGVAHSGLIFVLLARYGGGSSVRIESWDSVPPRGADWEDVVEVSVTIEGDERGARWLSWAGEEGGDLLLGPNTYRVRVSARGRDAGRDGEFAEELVDFYLLQFWAAPTEPDAVVAVGSENAEYLHGLYGQRTDDRSVGS